jgi:hypothetical protein
MYKKIVGNNNNCYQTIRENEERTQYMKTYKNELLLMFNDLLNGNENVIIPQEIHNIFETFIDKSVKHIIRKKQLLNPIKYEEDDDDDDDDDDDEDQEPQKSKSTTKYKNRDNISSNWGEDIILDK